MNNNWKFYRSLLARRLPAMSVLFFVFSIAGITAALRLPPTYEASARLIVETPQIPDELAASTVRISASEEIEFIKQRLLTRTHLLEIERRFGVLENTSLTPADEVLEEMRDRTEIVSFESGGTSRRSIKPTLVTVTFNARNGRIAANVVNELVTRIIDENVSLRTDTAEDTLDFFEQEVARLGEELDAKSKAISEFQRSNSDALPGDLPYRQGRLTLLQERITAADREKTALAEQKARLTTAFERTGGAGPTPQQPQLSPEERQLLALNAKLRQALTVFSESNPNVQNLRDQIELLKEQISTVKQEPAATADSAELMLELQLSEIDSRIESLEAEILVTEERVAQLVDSVSRTPNVAVTLDALSRDYENVRLQYDNAVQSLARANMGERIELTSRGQRITLIEPATVPNAPSSPNRPVVAAAGVGIGLMLAIGLFVLLELLNSTIRRPAELVKSLGIAPISTIPFMESTPHLIVRRTFKILVIFATIALILGGLFAIDQYYLPLELIVQKITRAVGL